MGLEAFGSPPRAWGRRCGRWEQSHSPSVHPHVRGDGNRSRATTANAMLCGSPPRAWGRPRLIRQPRYRICLPVHPHVRGDGSDVQPASAPRVPAWFTPTCVGTASPHELATTAPGVGSPPRAWGRLQTASANHAKATGRFTPTCVGTAPAHVGAGPRSSGTSVHPHVRGDGLTQLVPMR